jgi:hypothetical protein
MIRVMLGDNDDDQDVDGDDDDIADDDFHG